MVDSARTLTVAALQLALATADEATNIAAVSALVEQAAAAGAQVILPPELFSGPYFCVTEDEALFALARPTLEHPSVIAMRKLAAALKVAIPTSFFERDGHHYYNTLAMIGPDGEVMGTYRKSHIPDGPGYEEKFYFRPGNTGFRVWDVFGARIGVGVCWDQWYPECARAMALMGAEVLFYPTAIGSEPYDAGLDTSRMWRRAMQGHAVSNCMPVIAANRIGTENGEDGGAAQAFYGHSFICDEWGDFVREFGAAETGVLTATLDLSRGATHRAGMGFFRDRRPQLYGRLGEDV
jgi:N-carbamoylputrescine amidase